MEAIISAIITGVITLVGVLIANGKSQAVMETKVDELTRQVEKHNTVIERTYKLEGQMTECQHDIRDIKTKLGG